ncbi:hypothetical protein F4677DRAFT_392255 [Hypoxylon crocopeplum]|nr:hypothetical protein F4677DRAFT_392255 [Hypoxylon crocopeplum]
MDHYADRVVAWSMSRLELPTSVDTRRKAEATRIELRCTLLIYDFIAYRVDIMPGDGPSIDTSSSHAGEILSCVACRNRKLKCDRTKPRCNRCEKAKIECNYPESRRKPAFKRRNVKELEARLGSYWP